MTELRRYAAWAGNPKGVTEDTSCCIEEVQDHSGWHWYQCSRKRGYGEGGLYCKQHAKRHPAIDLAHAEKACSIDKS